MFAIDPADKSPGTLITRMELIERVGRLAARPFLNQVVKDPWAPVIDAPALHRSVKDLIQEVIDACGQTDTVRCLTVAGQPGAGKTHLLAWTRQLLDTRDDAVFVYVAPFTPGGAGGDSFEQHVMRATLDALRLRWVRQKDAFERSVRTFLTGCYDRILDSGRRVNQTLRAGTFWTRLLRPSKLRIRDRGHQDQLAALQRAFSRRHFFVRVFADFVARSPSTSDGIQADWDTFVAACLLTCGDVDQRWHADQWFRAHQIPLDVFARYHLDQPLTGQAKIRNGLFTLNALVGEKFCIAYDQLEETYRAIRKLLKPEEKPGELLTSLIGGFITSLARIPQFCQLFMFQLAVWSEFQSSDRMLVDRMTEGHGAQLLKTLDDTSSKDLIRERLDAAVWRVLKPLGPPEGEQCFPFTSEQIRQIRIESGGDLRTALKLAQEQYLTLLTEPAEPVLLRIVLTGIEPLEVIANEPTAVLIRGENIPPSVRVLFTQHPARVLFPEYPAGSVVVRPADGQIDATTPIGLIGDVQVRVEDVDDVTNTAMLVLRFVPKAVPQPYRTHIDGKKLKARREALGLSQSQVGESVKASLSGLNPQSTISRLERGIWATAPDDVYLRVAEVLKQPLSAFLKGG